MAEITRLHLGCGRTIKSGWINLDLVPGDGVDVVADLDACAHTPLPFEDDSIDEFLASHLLEHLHQPLPFMQELHRIAKPNAKAVFHVPYGSSDDAWTDPTHTRPYFFESFRHFAQPAYWSGDVGYRGDWEAEQVTLSLSPDVIQGRSPQELMRDITLYRNMVQEMVAELRAIKPVRPAKAELWNAVPLSLGVFAGPQPI